MKYCGMRLPRDLSGDDLIVRLEALGYCVSRQTGSHVRLTRASSETQMHLTVPRHGNLRVGTLNAILRDAAAQLELDKEALAERLFGKR